jgi:plastocyanin
MSSHKITIKPGSPAVFDPSAQIAFVNDSIYWSNDDNQQHWPTVTDKNPKSLLDYPIAPHGQSAQISMDPPAPYTMNYFCYFHPNEKGQIKVTAGKKKGPFGPKTKKGPFAPKTKKGPFGPKTKKGAYGGTTKY